MSSSGQFWLSCSMTCVKCAILSLEDSHLIVQELAFKFSPQPISCLSHNNFRGARMGGSALLLGESAVLWDA